MLEVGLGHASPPAMWGFLCGIPKASHQHREQGSHRSPGHDANCPSPRDSSEHLQAGWVWRNEECLLAVWLCLPNLGLQVEMANTPGPAPADLEPPPPCISSDCLPSVHVCFCIQIPPFTRTLLGLGPLNDFILLACLCRDPTPNKVTF